MRTSWILQGIFDTQARSRVEDGLRAAVRLYYEDMTDEDDLASDREFFEALSKLAEYTDSTVEAIITETEHEMASETGRHFAFSLEEPD